NPCREERSMNIQVNARLGGLVVVLLTVSTVAANAQDWSLAGNRCAVAGSCVLGTADNSPLAIETSGTERMRVDAAGNVGFGTATPAAMVDIVSGSGFDSPQIKLKQTTTSDYA